jgi:hypothetical protein
MVVKAYTPYKSSRFIVPCFFLYPSDWKIFEMVEQDECSWIYIGGPRNQSGLYTVSFKIALSQLSAETLEEATISLVSRLRSFVGYRTIGRAHGEIAGRPASEIEIAYSMLLPLNTVNPQHVVIRERHVLLEHNGQLLELSYSASEEDYATWLEAFHILVQTFSFVEESQTILSRPLVAETWIDVTESCDEKGSGEKSQ